MPLTDYQYRLETYQKEMRRRYRSYKRGGQQGLDMVWLNMMALLKAEYNKII